MSKECGPHCGIKDRYEGHCQCFICHGAPIKMKKRKTAKMAIKSSKQGKK